MLPPEDDANVRRRPKSKPRSKTFTQNVAQMLAAQANKQQSLDDICAQLPPFTLFVNRLPQGIPEVRAAPAGVPVAGRIVHSIHTAIQNIIMPPVHHLPRRGHALILECAGL